MTCVKNKVPPLILAGGVRRSVLLLSRGLHHWLCGVLVVIFVNALYKYLALLGGLSRVTGFPILDSAHHASRSQVWVLYRVDSTSEAASVLIHPTHDRVDFRDQLRIAFQSLPE